jgi:phospholipid/cholesterol/gamma-HCH transport system ATP-binding protein
VIFFDEPTTGLDPITSAELDRLILDTRAAFGTTIVIVTHDLDTAFHCSDRIVMLEGGRVVASGTPGEIRAIEAPNVKDFIERRARSQEIAA